MSEEPRSPWLYVGLGCGGCAMLIGLLAMVVVVGGFRMARGIERDMEDPVARTEKAETLLGAERLPEGYHAVFSLSVPFVFDMVILADRPAVPDEGLAEDTERLFVFVDLIRGDKRWQDFAEGRGDPSDVLAGQGIRMDRAAEEIDQGQFEIVGGRIDWLSQRGTLTVQDDRFDGLATFLFVRCDGSKRMRVGVWSNPDPHTGIDVDQADYRGTAADPAVVESFVRPFDLCGS